MVGRDAATVAKASAFSFEPLGICSSFQAAKISSLSVTRHTYLAMRWSRVSYSLFTCPTTSWESLCMMIFYEDMEIARSISARIASYSASLLDAGKSNRIACSILSPIRALSCKPTLAPVCREVPSTLRIHQSALLGSAFYWWIFDKNFANIYPFITKHGLYWMPNSLSSIAHRAILPDKSGLCMVLPRGKIGQHDNRVCLEVRANFFSRHAKSQRHLLKTGILSLHFRERFACKEHLSLFTVFIFFE